MRGQVVHVTSDASDGFIRADDGNRYPYAIADWISSEPAIVGASVDFEVTESRATMVCTIPANASSLLSELFASMGRHKGLLIGLAVFALLLIAINAAMVRGLFAGATGDEHGPIKTYQASGLANVRNMPTVAGSTVLRQLNPGDSFSGRIYLSPDGRKQWVKSEGAEEYVSIVNLADGSTADEVPVVVSESAATADDAIAPAADADLEQIKGVWLNAINSHCEAVGGSVDNPGSTSDCRNVTVVCTTTEPVSAADTANGISKKVRIAVSLIARMTRPFSSQRGEFSDIYIVGSFEVVNGRLKQVGNLSPLGDSWSSRSFRNEFDVVSCRKRYQ